MRYPKGSIQMGPVDFQMLRQVLRNQVVSRYQLRQLVELEIHGRIHEHSSSWRAFNWRLQRLLRCGLVAKHPALFSGHDEVLTLTKAGLRWLAAYGENCFDMVALSPSKLDSYALIHALAMCNVQIALKMAGLLRHWTSDAWLKSLLAHGDSPYAKVYDAVAELDLKGTVRTLGIEYERTRKTNENYREIAGRLQAETNLDAILYLAQDQTLLSKIAGFFTSVSVPVLFCELGEFRESLLNSFVCESNGNYVRLVDVFFAAQRPNGPRQSATTALSVD